MASDNTTIIGIVTAIATAFSGVISYLAKKLFEVLENERGTSQLERARGDRLESELLKLQEKTIIGLEAITSSVKEHIGLLKDRRKDV